MKRISALTLTSLLLVSVPVILGASEFDWVVRQVERDSGCRRMHIPFFGLAQFFVGVTHPAGASDLKLAIFEKPSVSESEFTRILEGAAQSRWRPMIRVRSRNESTNIYIQNSGQKLRLLIGTMEHGEATLVHLQIKPESLLRWVDTNRHR